MEEAGKRARAASAADDGAAEEIRRLFERYREMAARSTPRAQRKFARVTTPKQLRTPAREPIGR